MRNLAYALCLVAVAGLARADEMSTGDRLSILYSPRFSFTDDGVPLVTVEIMGGQSEVVLRGGGGVDLFPDGEGGAHISGARRWTIRTERAKPAVLRDWTVVERLNSDDDHGVTAAIQRWTERGFAPRQFELGTVFGVEGVVIDSRELLVAVAPVAAGKGAAKAGAIARKYRIETSVHQELAKRPEGTLVATSGDGTTTVSNPSVLWFAPRSHTVPLEVANVLYGGGGSQLGKERREDRRYFGMIYVTMGNDGRMVVVNAVDAETLLAGLVPAEIFPDASHEALKAQAVAARTELLDRIGTRYHTDPFLLCSSQQCQVYSGAGKEHPRTTRAVRATRGQVLVRPGGGLVDARYHASCGGHTEHKENIWGPAKDPALRGLVDATGAGSERMAQFETITEDNVGAFLASPAGDAFCGTTRYSRKRHRWTVEHSSAVITKWVAAKYPRVGKVRRLEPMERGVSGRIRELRIVGTRGVAIARGDLHIRRLLGGLKSSLFTVEAVGDTTAPRAFAFHGAGFGHGVGMCQTGAIGRAEQGHTYRNILRHYYSGSSVRSLY